MRMNELVEVYESTSRTAAGIRTWRLQRWARKVRRTLEKDGGNEAAQVRLVAIENELVLRGEAPTRTPPVRWRIPGPST
jgi:hypothetical protein